MNVLLQLTISCPGESYVKNWSKPNSKYRMNSWRAKTRAHAWRNVENRPRLCCICRLSCNTRRFVKIGSMLLARMMHSWCIAASSWLQLRVTIARGTLLLTNGRLSRRRPFEKSLISPGCLKRTADDLRDKIRQFRGKFLIHVSGIRQTDYNRHHRSYSRLQFARRAKNMGWQGKGEGIYINSAKQFRYLRHAAAMRFMDAIRSAIVCIAALYFRIFRLCLCVRVHSSRAVHRDIS